ncbi:MAG: aminotransferase class V-fold PLP-dependent enzyme [Calditrichota bacterium]
MMRSGVHCAALLAEHLGINSMVRASLYVYNTLEDVDKLCGALQNLQRYLGRN